MTEVFNDQSTHEQAPAQCEASFNNPVLVKITPAGEKLWHEHHAASKELAESIGMPGLYEITRDKDGYTRMQLWEVANIFGKAMSMGVVDLPVDMNFMFVNAN